MTITTFLAYLFVIAYFVVERVLREGDQARSLQPGPFDQGSSFLLLSVGVVNLLILLLAPVGNHYDIGSWDNSSAAWLGLLLMFLGLVLRYVAAQTLGQFYTRTLQICEAHQIVDQGLYRFIRHPGYLGLLVMEIGAGLAVKNWIAFLFISMTGFVSRLYRVRVEERMLEDRFGEQYSLYAKKTWRFLPFLY